MAKKKSRKLKKSVKRFLWGVLTFVVGGFLVAGLVVQRCSLHPEPKEQPADTINTEPIEEMRCRIDRLVGIPHNLDTANMAISVFDIESQQPVYRLHADRLAPPASCMKLLTAVSAMEFLGISHRFVTEVKLNGAQSGSTFYGTVLFQLDDDPLCETFQPMVDALLARGIRKIEGNIVLDLLRNDTLKAHPTASSWDIPYHKLPVLMKGHSRIHKDLLFTLQAQGISLHRNPLLAEPALQGISALQDPYAFRMAVNHVETHAETIYRHTTPLTDVLAPMLIHSSNIKADALAYHIDHAYDRIAGARAIDGRWFRSLLPMVSQPGRDDWETFVVNDGSGLSPENRLTADFLISLLQYAWANDDMRRVLIDEALATPAHPVRHGSLLGRMSAPLYRNRIFVKTGTLTTIGLSSLAGYARAADGHWYAFAIINENSPVADSRIFQDHLCRELVR